MKTNKKFSSLSRLFKYIYKFKKLFIFSLILELFIVVGTLIIPIFIGDAINFICGKNAVNFNQITSLLIKTLIVIIIVGICQFAKNLINNKMAYSVTYELRKDLFKKIQNLPLKYIDSYPYGEIVNKVMGDVDVLGDGLLMGFNQLFSGILTIVGILVCITLINPYITLIILVLTPMSLISSKFISKKTFSLFKNQAKLKGNQTAFIEERISNQKVLISYNQQKNNSLKFMEINKELEKTSMNALFYSSITNPTTRFINASIYAVVVLFGSFLIFKSNAFNIGDLTKLLYYANQYAKPFNEISGVFAEFQNTIACSQRIFELLDEKEQSPDVLLANLENPKGNIELKNVYFSYNENQKLIQNFNISIKQGQKVAIVGATGSGKTTLINLLMRFYDVVSGSISIDNINIYDMSRNNLRKCFGMVLQETFLKSGTIKDNIILGKPDATMEEIITASKKSFSYDFIKKLPKGFDTEVIEDGKNLSQGEKQLLCITRVMLCLPELLILDEATSNIDTRTELKIQNAFNELMENKTSFIVAHRLSTIKNVDIILVMSNGNIVEQGSHNELIKKQGYYYELYNSQFE